MNLNLKRDPAWLDCLPTPDISANILLLGGDGQQVAVPVPLLLAVSPVVRSILTDHLPPPAYSPCCLSLPAITGDVLQAFGEILATGAAAGAHEDKIEQVRQLFNMLGVEAWIVSCHLESIQVGQALDRDIKQEGFDEISSFCLDEKSICEGEIMDKTEDEEHIDAEAVIEETKTLEHALDRHIKQERLGDENNGPLEFVIKTEQKENIDLDIYECRTFRQSQSCPQNLTKKPSLNLQQTCISSVHAVHKKKEYPCILCPKKFNSKSNQVIHIKSVHDKIKFPCNLCPLKFTLNGNLLTHVKSVHDKIEIPCKLCTQKFTRRDSLVKHVKSHHDKIRIPCNLCTKKFTQKYDLKMHMDSPHKKKTIPCSLCLKKFTCKFTLERHTKSVHYKKSIEATC